MTKKASIAPHGNRGITLLNLLLAYWGHHLPLGHPQIIGMLVSFKKANSSICCQSLHAEKIQGLTEGLTETVWEDR